MNVVKEWKILVLLVGPDLNNGSLHPSVPGMFSVKAKHLSLLLTHHCG